MTNAFDFTKLNRANIGFDKIAELAETAMKAATHPYPPYNIEKLDADRYAVSLAVAGFSTDDLSVEIRDGALLVSGNKGTDKAERNYLHHGIALRSFERRFALAEHVRVESASHQDGILEIRLFRELPEALKSRKIDIAADKART